MRVGRTARIVGTLALGLVWLLGFVMAGATGLEFFLRVQSHWRPAEAHTGPRPKYDRLDHAYAQFGIGHLHPLYSFFFPLDPRERVAISNETCSLDADGFRGPGPAHAAGRRLAFILGGSAAFGVYANSDTTTITGYLNRLQDEYFFVNAGVPGWNSTQELFRVAYQILDYHPALIVTYDGANDIALLGQVSQGPKAYPIGTAGQFPELEAITDARAPSAGRALALLVKALLPELGKLVGAQLRRVGHARDVAAVGQAPIPESVMAAGADRYLANLTRIHDLTAAHGTRFVAVFQPAAQLHRHLGPGMPHEEYDEIGRFRTTVLAKYRHDFELLDLGDVFDRYYATVPVMSQDITDATIFVDEVHLSDPGNEIVARELSRIIR